MLRVPPDTGLSWAKAGIEISATSKHAVLNTSRKVRLILDVLIGIFFRWLTVIEKIEIQDNKVGNPFARFIFDRSAFALS